MSFATPACLSCSFLGFLLPWLPSTPDLSTCPGRLLCPHLCPTAPTRHASALPHAPWPPPSGHKWGGGHFLLPESCVPRKQTRITVFFSPLHRPCMSQPPNTASTFVVMVTLHPPPHGRFIPESLLRTLPETTCPSGALQRSPHPLSSTAVRPSFLTLPTQPRPVLAQGCSADPCSYAPLLLQGTAADFPASSMKPQPP